MAVDLNVAACRYDELVICTLLNLLWPTFSGHSSRRP